MLKNANAYLYHSISTQFLYKLYSKYVYVTFYKMHIKTFNKIFNAFCSNNYFL